MSVAVFAWDILVVLVFVDLLGGLQLWRRAERAVRARQRRRNARVAPTRSGGSCRVVHDWPAPPYEETLAQITQAKAVKPACPG